MDDSDMRRAEDGLLYDVSDIEVDILLDAVYKKYGYDFRDYSRAHVKRRILNRMRLSKCVNIGVLQKKVLNEPDFVTLFLRDLSIGVTEMFRDPGFYRAVREKVIPLLKTWSFLKLWHAGCSSGEEVYSMAILLSEEGLYDRTQIYATDFNQEALKKAGEGIYTTESLRKYVGNYQQSGAKSDFSKYYHAKYDLAIMDNSLKRNIVWANHNLVTDRDFAETHMVICRNVLIYFNRNLQNRAYSLFYTSLVKGGILCLGSKENIQVSDFGEYFETVDKHQRIYRKRYR